VWGEHAGLCPGQLVLSFSCPSLHPVSHASSLPWLASFCPCSGQAWTSLGTFLCHCCVLSVLREGVSHIQHQCLDKVHGPGPGLGSQRTGMAFVPAFCSETSAQQMRRPSYTYRAARIFQPCCKTKKACWAGDSRGSSFSPAILDLLSCLCFRY